MNLKDLSIGIGIGVIATSLLAYAYFSANIAEPKDMTLKINGPTGVGSIDLAFKGTANSIDYKAVLNQMFSNELMRDGVIGWLGKNQRIYSLEAVDFANALKTGACEPFPEKPAELRLQKRQECADKPSNDALRKLAFSGEAPFHSVGKKVRIGTQSESGRKPINGVALVCNEGEYANKKLIVVNASGLTKEFIGSPGYLCPDAKQFPEMQLNLDEAKELFGQKLNKYNFAIAYLGK